MPASDKKRLNILLTSVGRRVELIRAFRQAYEALDLEGHLVAVDIDPLAPGLQLADRTYLVPPTRSPDYVPELLNICRADEVSLVLPLIDPDILVLARHRDAFRAAGATAAVLPLEAAEVTSDKWWTYQFFRSLGIPTPESWLPDSHGSLPAAYPVFIKPRDGSAGEGAFVARDDREYLFFVEYVRNAIVQECLPGPEITTDVMCGLDGELLSAVSRRRIRVRSGEVEKGVTVYDPGILDASVAVAKALGTIGPITVQCMLKDGTPFFTEVNARLGGGVPLGLAAGVNSLTWLLARTIGRPVTIPPLGSYRTGLYMTRFDDSFFVSEPKRLAPQELASR